jgi:hypothetical protein
LKLTLAFTACLSALGTANVRAAELLLDGLVAHVEIIPEARSDFEVEVQRGDRNAPGVKINRDSGAKLTVTSGVQVGACASVDEHMRVGLRDGRVIDMADAAHVTIRAPETLTLRSFHSGLIGRMGPAANLDLTQGGCATWDVGRVEESLVADVSGGARVTTAEAGSAELEASFGAVLTTGDVGDLTADASGGGVIRVASATSVRASASGGGRVEIEGGDGGALRAEASGGGRVLHRGHLATLRAKATGGGRIDVAGAEQIITHATSGGGQIQVSD